MNVAAVNSQPEAKRERWMIGLLAVILTALVYAWFYFTPAGFWEKLNALGYSVCHQMDARSFYVEGIKFPLCARCTGMYLGALIGLAYHLGWGRKGAFPPLPIMYILAFFAAAFGIDGINSFTELLPFGQHLYTTTDLTRLISGAGMGVVVSAVAGAAFNQTVWADALDEPALDSLNKLASILIVVAVLLFGILGEYTPALYFSAVASTVAIFLVVSVLYTIIAVLLLKRDGKIHSARELLLPVLIGMSMAMIQIIVATLVRFALTHTWAPINL